MTLDPGIGYGVAAATSFGAGDFSGGLASRRLSVLAVVAGAQLAGLAAVSLLLLVIRPAPPSAAALALGVAAGLAGAVGLAALFRGMSLGSMGIVTALSGAGSLSIPLLVGALFQGGTATPLQLLGVGCAAGAGIAASGTSRGRVGRTVLLMAGLAALGFGAWYVLLDLAAEHGQLWSLVISRGTASLVTAALALRGGSIRAPRRMLALVGLSGLLDVAGNGFYVLAAGSIPVGLAAALTGLYPIVTMLLARLILGERLPRLGYLGVALALGGILLISLGG